MCLRICPTLYIILYYIRCAVVHNKATEFHISNERLSQQEVWKIVIRNICLHPMIKVAYGLPSVVSDLNPIRYKSRKIMLY